MQMDLQQVILVNEQDEQTGVMEKMEAHHKALLHRAFSVFIYKAEFENGLTEHEFDHVFTGQFNLAPEINKDEVHDYCYKSMAEIKQSLLTHPQKYTAWFKIAYPEIEKWWIKNFKQTIT